jgi:hypothetical protein
MNKGESVTPNKRLLDGAPYVNAAKTDIRELFKKMGYVPPSEQKKERDAQEVRASVRPIKLAKG